MKRILLLSSVSRLGCSVTIKDMVLLVYNNMHARTHTHAGCFMDQTMDLEGYRTVYVHRATLLPPADIQRDILSRMKPMTGGLRMRHEEEKHQHDGLFEHTSLTRKCMPHSVSWLTHWREIP